MSLVIKLVRHGESQANTGEVRAYDIGDHAVSLTTRGREQAERAGRTIGREFFEGALLYASPYTRTRETLATMLSGAGVPDLRVYEDPRLREVEHGYQDVEAQLELRRTHGWFYYRFEGGESPADCFDRTSSFLESLMRQIERKKSERVVIVTHGLTLRCFVMRFMHLSVEQFDALANPNNCAIVTLAPKSTLTSPLFTSGTWGVDGLELRPPGT